MDYRPYLRTARYSEEEDAFYNAIYTKNLISGQQTLEFKKAGELLKGIPLDTKDLGRFWNSVCMDSKTMDIFQFKLFCKLCSIQKAMLPFSQQNFEIPLNPIEFSKTPQVQEIGLRAVEDLKFSRAPKQVPQNSYMPQSPSQQQPQSPQPYYNNTQNQESNFPSPHNAYLQNNQQIPPQYQSSAYQPPQQPQPIHHAPPYSQPQPGQQTPPYSQIQSGQQTPPYSQPQHAQPSYQNQNNNQSYTSNSSGTSTPLIATSPVRPVSLVIDGTDPDALGPSDTARIRDYVERFPRTDGIFYPFSVLKDTILGFGLLDTKEATKIWKLVDFDNNKRLTQEGVISLFYLLGLAKKGTQIPPRLPSSLEKYIREKIPPYANLKEASIAVNTGNRTGGDGERVTEKSLELDFDQSHNKSQASFENFKKANSAALDTNRDEINQLKQFLATVSTINSKIQTEKSKIKDQIQDVKSANTSGGRSPPFITEFVQTAQRNIGDLKAFIQEISVGAGVIIKSEKSNTDKLLDLQRENDELKQRFEIEEKNALNRNFAFDADQLHNGGSQIALESALEDLRGNSNPDHSFHAQDHQPSQILNFPTEPNHIEKNRLNSTTNHEDSRISNQEADTSTRSLGNKNIDGYSSVKVESNPPHEGDEEDFFSAQNETSKQPKKPAEENDEDDMFSTPSEPQVKTNIPQKIDEDDMFSTPSHPHPSTGVQKKKDDDDEDYF